MASGPEGADPLKHQTSVLKVSIHCEGCKKKVKKVLQRVEGVYAIDIDSKQNKVTVTGSADAESLIRKLLKYGKHAELWPETKPSTSNSSSAAEKHKAKGEEKDAATTVPKPPETEQKQQAEGGKPAAQSPSAVTTAPSPAADPAAAISDDALKHNIDIPKNAGDEPVKSEKPATKEESEDIKEKGKKVQRELAGGEERAVSDSKKSAAARSSTATIDSMNPPPLHPFPTYPQPVYTMSYSTAQPSISYAYYAPSPEAAISSSYTAYSGYPPSAAYPPVNYSDSYYGSMEAPAMSEGSYDMFNDENPNACNLM